MLRRQRRRTLPRRPHHNTTLRTPIPTQLSLNIRPVLDILEEVANAAADFLVGFEAERYDGDEAEGEPFPRIALVCQRLMDYSMLLELRVSSDVSGDANVPSLDDVGGVVTAVLALDC